MQPFRQHIGLVAPLDRPNVDTDQIIPKQFLKLVQRTGFGQYLFFDWRFLPDGSPDADFVLNASRYQGASILIAGRNFGCGSSREHAVWALQDYGFQAVIAPSFADIFYSNWLGNGLVPVTVPELAVQRLTARALELEGYRITVDVENLTVSDSEGFSQTFTLDPIHQHRLLNGLDDIGLTLRQESAIAAFEAGLPPVREAEAAS